MLHGKLVGYNIVAIPAAQGPAQVNVGDGHIDSVLGAEGLVPDQGCQLPAESWDVGPGSPLCYYAVS